MQRREFIAGLGGTVAWPLAAQAQQTGRVKLVAVLMPYPESNVGAQARVHAFRQQLTELGWSEGGNVRFEARWATDNMDLVRVAARDLVELKPDVIVSAGDRVIPILTQLTRSIPIVAAGSDLAGSGFVESVARPGGNVTGFSTVEFSVVGKMLETLKRIAPGISRVGMIHNPDNPAGADYWRSFNAFATKLAIEPIDLPVHGLAETERAIGSLAEQSNGGLLVPGDVTMLTLATEVTALAARYNIPAVYSASLYVTRGGLVSYGADLVDQFRRQAFYVDRILRGEKPGDLPIQQPNSYQLFVNLKTATAIGLTIPETLLATADEVIQ
jgi:putative ABC transport system substrate-binding protein